MFNLIHLGRYTLRNLINVDVNYDYLVIVTHSGSFHEDDVMSVALIRWIAMWHKPAMGISVLRFSDASVKRAKSNITKHLMRNTDVEAGANVAVVIVDIGGGDFDHHDMPVEYRPNGNKMPYASFGKIWRAIGPSLVGKVYAENIDATIAYHVDKMDVGLGANPLGILLSNFNPSWETAYSQDVQYEAFMDAVDTAQYMLDKLFSKINASQKAHRKFSEIYFDTVMSGKDPSIIVLDKFIPIGMATADDCADVKIVISKSMRGQACWVLTPISGSDRKCRCPIPKEWQLEVSRPEGCIDVRKSFLKFTLKRDAIAAAHEMLRINGVENTEHSEKLGGGV